MFMKKNIYINANFITKVTFQWKHENKDAKLPLLLIQNPHTAPTTTSPTVKKLTPNSLISLAGTQNFLTLCITFAWNLWNITKFFLFMVESCHSYSWRFWPNLTKTLCMCNVEKWNLPCLTTLTCHRHHYQRWARQSQEMRWWQDEGVGWTVTTSGQVQQGRRRQRWVAQQWYTLKTW